MSRRERQRRKRRNRSGPQRAILLTLGLLCVAGLIAGGSVVGWVISVANSAPPLDTSKPMQLVRNLYTGEKQRTLKRKIREAKLAEDLENLHPGRRGKLWILTKYLNSVPFGTVGGQTAIGIQAGARLFFDKPASELKLREAALLAGLPQAPSQYNPFLNPSAAKRRRDDVLQRMADQGYIKQVKAQRKKRMGLGVKRNRFYTSRREGYFFDFVKQELIDKYGLDTVRRGGLRIDTTIDLRLQRLARKTMDGNLRAPHRSAAIVTIDPRTR